ncbi:uncharacterized protein QYS62_002214 [Fusarium acuminatum]|uniref:CFEM domain-containing protein n=1 Tax=Fusarium acuminatum TaxID=5515 RepID=A0ABZ2WKR9_9HYPO
MANKNAKSLYEAIPECIAPCFDTSIANTGCPDKDYDCWCYKTNHQTVVDSLEICLKGVEVKTGKTCTKNDHYDFEQSYWGICKEYWEPTGTATDPKSYPTSPATSSDISSKTTLEVSTTEAATTSSATEESTTSALESSWTSSADATETGSSELSEASGAAESTSSGGLSTGGKAGVGVGVALGLILIGAAIFLWLRERRKRRNMEERLRAIEEEKANVPYGGGYHNNVMYEMEGDRPHAEELRGSMTTPEMGANETVKSGSMTQFDPVSPSDNDKDSTFSSRSQDWPISPESPSRQEPRGLGAVPNNSASRPAAP